MKTDIITRENPILRKKAHEVKADEIGSKKITEVISKMSQAMHSQKDGVAIAAPQIGESLQIFVVSGELLSKADKTYKGDATDLVFINPKIVRRSRDRAFMEEGCLSVRWFYGKVERSTKVTLTAINEKGEKIERGASGLLAQIFQHECDHLSGVLFTDKATELWEMSEEEIAELEKKE